MTNAIERLVAILKEKGMRKRIARGSFPFLLELVKPVMKPRNEINCFLCFRMGGPFNTSYSPIQSTLLTTTQLATATSFKCDKLISICSIPYPFSFKKCTTGLPFSSFKISTSVQPISYLFSSKEEIALKIASFPANLAEKC